eukprot:4774401-Pyramimonas_sp.AAC.1
MGSRAMLGLNQQQLADTQTLQIIAMIQNARGLSHDDGLKITAEVAGGPWSDANKAAIGGALNDC